MPARPASCAPGAPLLPDIGVLALVPDQWGFPMWRGRHHRLSRLARYFHLVWSNPAHQWQDVFADRRSNGMCMGSWFPPAGLTEYTPSTWLPLLSRPQGWRS
jgi:hypothetical protein